MGSTSEFCSIGCEFNYGKCSKISNTFLFLLSNKMFVITAGIHTMLERIAYREDHNQTASSNLGLHCLSRNFGGQIVFKILEHQIYY